MSNSGPVTGANFTLSAAVSNTGDGGSPATTLRYYRSTDATVTTSDTVVGTEAVAVLAASGSSSGSVDLTAPLTVGTYYYGACVDTVTGESDTTNNCSPSVEVEVTVLETQTTLPGQPDLEVGVPTVSVSTPETGASFTLSATVSNAGDGESPATTLRYYRSTDATITTADTAVGTDAVGTLSATTGASAGSISLTAPVTAGAYYYGACVDAVTDESDTTNNCSASVKVDVEAPKYPDLEVGTPTVSDSTPETGASFTLSATVSNAGDAESPATTLRYYRSMDATITRSDTSVGMDDVVVLSAAGTSAESISLTAPVTAGAYYYGACVNSVTGESDTTNNCSASVKVDVEAPKYPDLEVGTPTVSDSTPETGASFTLSATVSNTGDGESPATALRYYRSMDETITRSDTSVGTDAVAGLAAAGTSAVSISLTAPLTGGPYYYGACVDAVTGESDTTNNCSSAVEIIVLETQQQVQGQPDLTIAALYGSQSAGTISLSVQLRNSGNEASAATTLRYYQSADATITASDTEVGTVAVAAVDASDLSLKSISLTAPTATGTYYYGACVDAVAGESNTANNCSRSVSVTVPTPKPDLEVSTFSVDDITLNAGETFTMTAVLRNAGDVQSAASTLRFYRSSDSTISSSDTQVDMFDVAALDALRAGATAVSVLLDAPATAGTYYYGACVDTVSGETNTTNNCSGAVTVTVTAVTE